METLYLILAMLAGVTIRFLFKLDSAKRSSKPLDISMFVISAGLSIITMLFLIFVREDIKEVLPFSPFLAGVYGYTGDSLFRAMMKKFKPNVND